MHAFKAFNSDFTCRGMKFTVGETYTHEGLLMICQKGFHCCRIPLDVDIYYDKNSCIYALVEILGDYIDDDRKTVTNKLKIIRQLSRDELMSLQPEKVVRSNGDIEWYKNGKRHRDGGLPAIEYAYGVKEWYVDGKLHRDGGLPAIEYASGSKHWYVNGRPHRDGGLPAIECADGSRDWYVNGRLHRDGGLPAIEYASGSKYWYVNDGLHRDGGLPAIEYTDGSMSTADYVAMEG